MNKAIFLKIHGRVQMVMYRDSARRKANKLNLTGWVMNKPDGTVELFAEGKEENLKQFIDWCYNGPVLAKVEKIDIKWQNATCPDGSRRARQFNKFEIKYK